MVSYLIQMNCWLLAFGFIYFVFLKQETFFRLNRYFLVLGLVLAVFAPLLPISYPVYQAVEPFRYAYQSLKMDSSEQMVVTRSLNLGLLLYLAGSVLYLFRLLLQFLKLYRMRKQSRYTFQDSIKIYHVEKEMVPFSFFNSIYIRSSMHDATEIKTVLAHEKVHILERHWTDLLLLEVVRTLQWFNPFLRIYRKAILQNHEYLADAGTLRYGVNVRTYKAVLVNQMLNMAVINLGNSFTKNNATKRFLMMKRNSSIPVKKLKLLLVFPLIAVILMSFAKPEYVYVTDTQTSPEPVLREAEALPHKLYASEDKAISDEKAKQASTRTVHGTVINTNGEALPGVQLSLLEQNGTLLSQTTSNAAGEFTLSEVRSGYLLAANMAGYEPYKLLLQEQENIRIQLAANQTDLANSISSAHITVTSEESDSLLAKTANKIEDILGKQIVYVDGVKTTEGIEDIDPSSIEKITILKGDAAVAKYGEEAAHGVILIRTVHSTEPVEEKVKAPIVKQDSSLVFFIVEEMPEFKGGGAALRQWITDQIKYPEAAKAAGKEGKVFVQFNVNKYGQVVDAKVVKGVSPALDQEALRVIQSLPDWTPGYQRGEAVKVSFTVPVSFKL